jgi:hypothetical protein
VNARKQGLVGRGKELVTGVIDQARREYEFDKRWKAFIERDIQQERRLHEVRQGALIELFGSQHEAVASPMSGHSLRVYAEQRASLELLAQQRMFLPTKGLRGCVSLLTSRGFYFRWELGSSLTPTLFPHGWEIDLPEPTTANTERAQLVDSNGVARLEIFYRVSKWNDTDNLPYVHAVS